MATTEARRTRNPPFILKKPSRPMINCCLKRKIHIFYLNNGSASFDQFFPVQFTLRSLGSRMKKKKLLAETCAWRHLVEQNLRGCLRTIDNEIIVLGFDVGRYAAGCFRVYLTNLIFSYSSSWQSSKSTFKPVLFWCGHFLIDDFRPCTQVNVVQFFCFCKQLCISFGNFTWRQIVYRGIK